MDGYAYGSRLILDAEFYKELYNKPADLIDDVLRKLSKINNTSLYSSSKNGSRLGAQNIIIKSELGELEKIPSQPDPAVTYGIGAEKYNDDYLSWADKEKDKGQIYKNLSVAQHSTPFKPNLIDILTSENREKEYLSSSSYSNPKIGFILEGVNVRSGKIAYALIDVHYNSYIRSIQ